MLQREYTQILTDPSFLHLDKKKKKKKQQTEEISPKYYLEEWDTKI